MPDRLVHLKLHLLRGDHDRRHRGRALVGAEQRGRLLGDARRLALEAEALDELPAGLRARADVGARVAAHLEEPVADRHRVDAAAALDELLLDLDAVGGEEQLALALRADRAWATLTSACFIASSARRQSATLSSSGTSNGSCWTGVR